MEKIVEKIFEQHLNLKVSGLQIVKLFGHASYRTYFRVILPDGKTYILMQMPAGISSVSEEITNYQGVKEELPYLNIQRYLKNLEIPVPAVLAWAAEEGIMVLEDLGDRLLESYVSDTPDALRIPFYKKAIDRLVEIQKKTRLNVDKSCIAFHRSFDETLLNWEFDHFLEYGIEDRLKIKISEGERKIFTETTREISRQIANSPFCFVHRDYQSRNLMMKDYEVYVIDFQDALMGPEPYDLVALTRDSYIPLSWTTVEKLIDYYLEKRKEEKIEALEPQKFKTLFDLVTLQRKLKDTGRFQFIHTVKGNSNFLVSVPASLGYVKEAFKHLPEYEPLQKWIAGYLDELK